MSVIIDDDGGGDHGRCEGVPGAAGDWWLLTRPHRGARPHAALPTPPPPPQSGSDTRKLPQIGIPALKLAHDTTLIVTIPS